MTRAKTLFVLRVIAAGMIVLVLTLLSDYCRYVIEHHGHHWDIVVAICAGTQGLIFGISLIAMVKLLEALTPSLR